MLAWVSRIYTSARTKCIGGFVMERERYKQQLLRMNKLPYEITKFIRMLDFGYCLCVSNRLCKYSHGFEVSRIGFIY